MITISREGLLSLQRWCESNDEALHSHISAISAGMSIAFCHPEYAQAFVSIFQAVGLTGEMQRREADEFVRNVPLEGLLPSNGSH